MPEHANALAIGFELALVCGGLALLWPVAVSPAARARSRPVPLAPWNAPLIDFLLFLWCAVFGGLVFPLLALQLYPLLSFGEHEKLVLMAGAFQGGMLIGVLAFIFFTRRRFFLQPITVANPLVAGAATFLISLPLVMVAALAWERLLRVCGLPIEPQDAVYFFTKEKSPTLIVLMTLVPTILAPISEELIFRAGIFRYARTRLPRWAALLAPAFLFAAVHQSLSSLAPLVVLGVIFSLAYERTGRIGTSIVAHALFNLHTIVLVLLGAAA